MFHEQNTHNVRADVFPSHSVRSNMDHHRCNFKLTAAAMSSFSILCNYGTTVLLLLMHTNVSTNNNISSILNIVLIHTVPLSKMAVM